MTAKEKDKGLLLGILTVVVLLPSIAMPTYAELTNSDLTKIENMILRSEKHMIDRVDSVEGRIRGEMNQMREEMKAVEGRIRGEMDRMREEMRYNFTVVWVVMAVGFAFLSILIGVPQAITTIQSWRERRTEGREIAALKERLSQIEMMLKAKT
ncbi:MAG: hypothetical protein ACUVXI_13765 [bacterium]